MLSSGGRLVWRRWPGSALAKLAYYVAHVDPQFQDALARHLENRQGCLVACQQDIFSGHDETCLGKRRSIADALKLSHNSSKRLERHSCPLQLPCGPERDDISERVPATATGSRHRC